MSIYYPRNHELSVISLLKTTLQVPVMRKLILLK